MAKLPTNQIRSTSRVLAISAAAPAGACTAPNYRRFTAFIVRSWGCSKLILTTAVLSWCASIRFIQFTHRLCLGRTKQYWKAIDSNHQITTIFECGLWVQLGQTCCKAKTKLEHNSRSKLITLKFKMFGWNTPSYCSTSGWQVSKPLIIGQWIPKNCVADNSMEIQIKALWKNSQMLIIHLK